MGNTAKSKRKKKQAVKKEEAVKPTMEQRLAQYRRAREEMKAKLFTIQGQIAELERIQAEHAQNTDGGVTPE